MTPTSRDRQTDAAVSQDALQEPLDSLSIELGRISAEIQSINSGFQVQMQQVFAEARAAIETQYETKFHKAIGDVREKVRIEVTEELRKNFEAELKQRIGHLEAVQNEMVKVTTQLEGVAREIAAMLDDPSIELSKVMRKRSEQAELKAYLGGLRFSIGEKPKTKAAE
jgi:SMC interacting uncharacterized protein involved in chromosome segregation